MKLLVSALSKFIIGLLMEDKLIVFEDRIAEKIRNRKN